MHIRSAKAVFVVSVLAACGPGAVADRDADGMADSGAIGPRDAGDAAMVADAAMAADASALDSGLDAGGGDASVGSGGVTQIAVGWSHICVLRDSTISCWGQNRSHQTEPPPGAFKQISAEANFNCAIDLADTLHCWGDDRSGQSRPPSGRFLSVDAGEQHACALAMDRTIVCWGSNDRGQITPPSGMFLDMSAGGDAGCAIEGDGDLSCWGAYPRPSGGVPLPPGSCLTCSPFTRVSVGEVDTCTLRANGNIGCFGFDYGGSVSGTPSTLDFSAVSAGRLHNCGLHTDGSVECWGDWFGPSTPATSLPPTTGTYVAVSAGWQFAAALSDAGEVVTFPHLEPMPAASFTQVAMGPNYGYAANTCGLETDGTVACWGLMPFPTPSTTFAQITYAHRHGCGIRTADGNLVCWGDLRPAMATPPSGAFTAIALSDYFGLAIRDDHTLVRWGDHPLTIPGTYTQVATNGGTMCGISTDETVDCWVLSGAGDVVSTTSPTGTFREIAVAGVTCGLTTAGEFQCWGVEPPGSGLFTAPPGPFSHLAAGRSHLCAIRAADNTVVCWGDNTSGQATPPPGAFDQIAAGDYGTCAVGGGRIACWGDAYR